MADHEQVAPGDIATTAQVGLCVGGLVRTWTASTSQLWSVREPSALTSVQARGLLARTVREERRFREAALLVESTGTMLLQSRFPSAAGDDHVDVEGSIVALGPAGEPSPALAEDVRQLLLTAVRHCARSGEFLVVELGGFDAPTEPFCLFAILRDGDDHVSVIETAPDPVGSSIWQDHIVAGRPSQRLSARASPDTIDVAPRVMLDAISTWGVPPWDLALTFGQR